MALRPALIASYRPHHGKLAFLGVVALIFFGLLIYSFQGRPPRTVVSTPDRLQTGEALTMRQDTALPGCDGQDAVQGVQGELVRNGSKARVIGMTDIHEVSRGPAGSRSCQATVNLDFGTQPVDYTIRRLGNSRTWELVLTAR